MPVRKAEATWEGTLREGKGTIGMESGAYEGAYSFSSRFEEGEGTNPEELIAAAHAGCFSMALSAELSRAGYDPESVHTEADVHLERKEGDFAITKVVLHTEARVPGIDKDEFLEIAEGAKKGCPVSKALSALDIEMDAKLVS
ncbi:MAG: OsmC family protein [Halobacteria archaeon]|nr:OsmC family protein [Halobacteria archaeon]